MKKIIIFLFNFILIFSLISCSKSNNTNTLTTDEPSTTITTPSGDNQTTKEDETANMKL